MKSIKTTFVLVLVLTMLGGVTNTISAAKVFDVVVGTYSGEALANAQVRDLRSMGFGNAFSVGITDDKGRPMKRVVAERAQTRQIAVRIQGLLKQYGVQGWIWEHQAGSSDVISSARVDAHKRAQSNAETQRGKIGSNAITMRLSWRKNGTGYFCYDSNPNVQYSLRVTYTNYTYSDYGPSQFTIQVSNSSGKVVGEFRGTFERELDFAVEKCTFTGTYYDKSTGKSYRTKIVWDELV